MGDELTTTRAFSRRNFIKGAAVVTAAGALVGCSNNSDNLEPTGDGGTSSGEDQLFAGVCRGNCAGGCFVNVHVRDGKVVRTSARELPNPEYNRICARGLTHVGRIYSAERLQYPMRRTGERGAGEFERITWDEAIDEIAEKWQSYTDEFGPTAMAMMTGSGNYAVCSGVAFGSAVTRFNNIMGVSTIPINVDAAHGRMIGIISGMSYYGTNNEPADFKNAKTFICWGANPAVSQPQVMHFILEAKDAGTKYVVVDPVYNANASKADWHLPVVASTDGLLALGAMHEVFEQGWEDIDFIRDHTEAPLLVKDEDGMLLHMSDVGVEPTEGDVDPLTGEPTIIDPYGVWDEEANAVVALDEATKPALEGITEVEGIAVKTVYTVVKEIVAQHSPAAVSQTCGIPEEDIKELARVYAQDGPVTTYAMFGDNHYINGHYNYWPIYALSFITGNCGYSGAGVGFSEVIPSHVTNFGATMPTDSAGNLCQGAGMGLLINEVGNVLDTNSFVGQDITLKGVYISNTNPMSTMAEWEKTRDWLTRMEFVVVADMNMTETAMYADILLPAAHWFEQIDMFTSFGSCPYIMLQEQAIEPLYESKTDFEIYKLLAEKMGYGEFWDITPEEYIQEILNAEGAQAMGITYERLLEEKAINILPSDNYVAYEGGQFVTATGRARFYQDTITPDYNVGQDIDESKERTLYWEPALEAALDSEARKKHPYHVISEHMRTRTHSQWWDVDYLKEYEPEPIVRINPEDAAELGVAEGDNVRMYNDRGSVILKAVINAGMPRKTLLSPRSFNAQEFIEGHFASISTNQFNQVCANQSFNDAAVSIEKA